MKTFRQLLSGTVLVLAISGCAEQSLPVLPDIYFDAVPDLSQQSPVFDQRYDNDSLCAPVAVSNSLAWLLGGITQVEQIELVNHLAQYRYMGTRPSIGTSPTGLIQGLTRYFDETDHAVASLEYAGLRSVSEELRAAVPLSLAWLHAGLTERSAVWVNLGWYRSVVPGVYTREGGHWVTLAGYMQGGLVFHDPGPWQKAPSAQRVSLRSNRLLEIEGWQLAASLMELPDFLPPREDYVFIDGAVRLKLAP